MEQEDADAKALAELQRKQAEWRRERIRSEVENRLLLGVAIALVAMYLVALMWAIRLHRESQLLLPWGS
jgi:Ca2+/H+ antiporter